jgi:hypothetical protein
MSHVPDNPGGKILVLRQSGTDWVDEDREKKNEEQDKGYRAPYDPSFQVFCFFQGFFSRQLKPYDGLT